MAIAKAIGIEEIAHERSLIGPSPGNVRVDASAVSWGAIVAGAAAAAALSLILLILGTGLGLSSVSPWTQNGVSAATFGMSAILWVTFTQLAAAAMGGYLAGRLRTKWAAVHTDEVYFRDTAHGFLAWAVASLATAALLTSAIGSIVRSGIETGAPVAAAAVGGAAAAGKETSRPDSSGGPTDYFVDALFRKDANAAASAVAGSSAALTGTANQTPIGSEVARIFAHSIRTGALPPEDRRYVGQVVAQHTGLAQPDAEKRVGDLYALAQAKLRDTEAAAKQAADKARKVSAYASLWLFIALLIGAFVASLAATYGGRQRDR